MSYTVIFLICSETETAYEIQWLQTETEAKRAKPKTVKTANMIVKTILPGYHDESEAIAELLD
jgi:hypothetical protein